VGEHLLNLQGEGATGDSSSAGSLSRPGGTQGYSTSGKKGGGSKEIFSKHLGPRWHSRRRNINSRRGKRRSEIVNQPSLTGGKHVNLTPTEKNLKSFDQLADDTEAFRRERSYLSQLWKSQRGSPLSSSTYPFIYRLSSQIRGAECPGEILHAEKASASIKRRICRGMEKRECPWSQTDDDPRGNQKNIQKPAHLRVRLT